MKFIKKGLILIFFFAVGQLSAAVDPKLARKGKEYSQTLYQGGTVPNTVDAIVAMFHYWYSEAIKKNEGKDFASGTIVIEDPGKKLYSFLWKYVRRNFPGGDMCSPPLVAGSPAYSRQSTHFIAYLLYMGYASKGFLGMINKHCDYMHYGIDIPKRLSLPIPTIPKKKHVLFGWLGEIGGSQWLFVKPEEAGLRGIQAIKHTVDLIKKKVLGDIILKTLNDLKRQAESTLAKDFVIRKALEGIKLVPDDKDSISLYRREGVLAGIMVKFLALLLSPDNRLNKIEQKNLTKKAKALGIRGIVAISKDLSRSNKINLKLRKDFENLAIAIMKQYPDDWSVRFGNEVRIP